MHRIRRYPAGSVLHMHRGSIAHCARCILNNVACRVCTGSGARIPGAAACKNEQAKYHCQANGDAQFVNRGLLDLYIGHD